MIIQYAEEQYVLLDKIHHKSLQKLGTLTYTLIVDIIFLLSVPCSYFLVAIWDAALATWPPPCPKTPPFLSKSVSEKQNNTCKVVPPYTLPCPGSHLSQSWVNGKPCLIYRNLGGHWSRDGTQRLPSTPARLVYRNLGGLWSRDGTHLPPTRSAKKLSHTARNFFSCDESRLYR